MSEITENSSNEINNATRCPHLREKIKTSGSCIKTQRGAPILYRFSELNEHVAISPFVKMMKDWMYDFVAKPHADLGRKGAVCPWVPLSLKQDKLFFVEIDQNNLTEDEICQILIDYRDKFLSMEPTTGTNSLQKSFVILFPFLGPNSSDIIDSVHFKMKKEFVENRLMLGDFYENNFSPGLRNIEFRPLCSPVPMLVIRYMVETDLFFLESPKHPLCERAFFLRSYLTAFRGQISASKMNDVLDSLIKIEIEQRKAKFTINE